MNNLYKKKERTLVIAHPHNSFPPNTFPVVICSAMPPVTRSKKAILYPSLNLLANKRTRHTKKAQQKVDENIQVTFIIMSPCHSIPDKD